LGNYAVVRKDKLIVDIYSIGDEESTYKHLLAEQENIVLFGLPKLASLYSRIEILDSRTWSNIVKLPGIDLSFYDFLLESGKILEVKDDWSKLQ